MEPFRAQVVEPYRAQFAPKIGFHDVLKKKLTTGGKDRIQTASRSDMAKTEDLWPMGEQNWLSGGREDRNLFQSVTQQIGR